MPRSKVKPRAAAIKHLVGLTKLEWLDLRRPKVTSQVIAALQKALPGCKIMWEGK